MNTPEVLNMLKIVYILPFLRFISIILILFLFNIETK